MLWKESQVRNEGLPGGPGMAPDERWSISELSTYRWTFEEDIFRYRKAGFGAVGIWRPKLADYGELKGKELLDEFGLRVSSVSWAGGFTGSDGRSISDAIEDALEAIRLTRELNCQTLVLMVGSRDGHTRKHAARMVRSALKELVGAALEYEVQLAVEPMHWGCAHDCTFLTDIPQTLDLIAPLTPGPIGIVFDCYHLGHDEATQQWLPHWIPWIKLVQLADAHDAPRGEQNRCLLGAGGLPIRELVECLERYGYEGFYEVELIGEQIEHGDYLQMLDKTRHSLHGLWQPGGSNS